MLKELRARLRANPTARRIHSGVIAVSDLVLAPAYLLFVVLALILMRAERRRTQRDYDPTRGWN